MRMRVLTPFSSQTSIGSSIPFTLTGPIGLTRT